MQFTSYQYNNCTYMYSVCEYKTCNVVINVYICSLLVTSIITVHTCIVYVNIKHVMQSSLKCTCICVYLVLASIFEGYRSLFNMKKNLFVGMSLSKPHLVYPTELEKARVLFDQFFHSNSNFFNNGLFECSFFSWLIIKTKKNQIINCVCFLNNIAEKRVVDLKQLEEYQITPFHMFGPSNVHVCTNKIRKSFDHQMGEVSCINWPNYFH